MTNTVSRNKANPFLLSEQVKSLLHKRGLSKIFNYSDYDYFKKKVTKSFNKPQAIAELFIEDTEELQSDFNEYIF